MAFDTKNDKDFDDDKTRKIYIESLDNDVRDLFSNFEKLTSNFWLAFISGAMIFSGLVLLVKGCVG